MVGSGDRQGHPPYILKGGLFTTESAIMTMSSLMSEAATVVSNTLGWVGDAVNTITSHPFLLATFGILMLGGAVGIMGRLLSRN